MSSSLRRSQQAVAAAVTLRRGLCAAATTAARAGDVKVCHRIEVTFHGGRNRANCKLTLSYMQDLIPSFRVSRPTCSYRISAVPPCVTLLQGLLPCEPFDLCCKSGLLRCLRVRGRRVMLLLLLSGGCCTP